MGRTQVGCQELENNSGHLPSSNFSPIGAENKKAFTLAEVLITLVVIGVIAAITVPVMMTNIKERETVSKVKKMYSVLSSALTMAIKDNGPVDYWAYDIDKNEVGKTFAQYFKNNINVMQDCGENQGCLEDTKYKYLNGSEWSNYEQSIWHYKMILNDGSTIWLRTEDNYSNEKKCVTTECGYQNACGQFWYDTNGKKKPNQFGKDTFHFAILRDRIAPCNVDNCYYNAEGNGCTKHIIEHDNMKYPESK